MAKKLSKEEKIEMILESLAAGQTRDELAEVLGYKNWRGIDVFMRREGYLLEDGNYVLPEQEGEYKPERFLPGPVRIVLNQLEKGNRDLSDIAVRAGFKTRRDLTNYMKSQGWLWCTDQNTYIKEGLVPQELAMDPNDEQAEESNTLDHKEILDSSLDRFLPLLEFLEANQDQLESMLQNVDSNQIPKYNFHAGHNVTKSVFMSGNLDQLIRDFSTEMGVSQRVMFETALIQFMERYGYAKQVKVLLES